MIRKMIGVSLFGLLLGMAVSGCGDSGLHPFDASAIADATASGGGSGQGGAAGGSGGQTTTGAAGTTTMPGGQPAGGAAGTVVTLGGQPAGGAAGTATLGGQPAGGAAGTTTTPGGQLAGNTSSGAPAGTVTGGQPAGGAAGTIGGGSGGQSSGGMGGTLTTGGRSSGGAGGTSNGGSGGQSSGGFGGTVTTTGGRSSGGSGGTAGGSGGQSSGGSGGSSTCPVLSQTKSSRSAHSAGFSGTQEAYSTLYNVTCTTVADCQAACVKVGGTSQSCAASECTEYVTNYCLPPTYWYGFDQLLIEAGTIDSSAAIIMVYNPYRDQLVADNFQFEIPAGATVKGIMMSINRAADMEDDVGDYEVKLMRDGATVVGLDRSDTKAWTVAFKYANYGGATDGWGTTWTPADVNAPGFGVGLTPLYLLTAGNGRAYVDFIRATVYYSLPCP